MSPTRFRTGQSLPFLTDPTPVFRQELSDKEASAGTAGPIFIGICLTLIALPILLCCYRRERRKPDVTARSNANQQASQDHGAQGVPRSTSSANRPWSIEAETQQLNEMLRRSEAWVRDGSNHPSAPPAVYASFRGFYLLDEDARRHVLEDSARRNSTEEVALRRMSKDAKDLLEGGEQSSKEGLKERNNDSLSCSICFEILDSRVTTKLDCGHCFHFGCVSSWLSKSMQCPLCRKGVAVLKYGY